MTYRELLELAAKASGWTWWQSKHGYWNIKGPDCEERAACCGWHRFDFYTGRSLAEPTPADALMEVGFNPLEDDGEALRLAVYCGIDIKLHDDACQASSQDARFCCSEPYGDDPYEATRRAIVRAAAEIGKELKS